MICTLTARRLKPGAYDDFRAAWGRGHDERPDLAERWNPVYLTRDVSDENVVLAFGMFNGTLEELRAVQEEYGYGDRRSEVDGFVEEVLLDGAYEVIEQPGA